MVRRLAAVVDVGDRGKERRQNGGAGGGGRGAVAGVVFCNGSVATHAC